MRIKIFILSISVIYCSYLVSIFIANYYASPIINPLNSEYYYKRGILSMAIEREPSNAFYHAEYAKELLNEQLSSKFDSDIQFQFINNEFLKATKLAPYNKSYKRKYNIYNSWLNHSLN